MMGTNDFNKTPEVSTSVESKNSRSLPFKKKLTTLALGIALTTGLSHAQNTTPDTNKALTQTEMATDTIPSVDTILAKYNIDLATIDTNNDYNNLVAFLDELTKIGQTFADKNEDIPESYMNAFMIIDKRITQIKKNKSAAELAQLKKETEEATKKAEEATKKAEQSAKELEEVKRVFGGNK